MEGTKIDLELEEELDKQFPKGDSARGRALILFTFANIKINKIEEEYKFINQQIKDIKNLIRGLGRSNLISKNKIQEILEREME